MSCYWQRHTWTRAGSEANIPAILDDERCDCGLYTFAECRHYEQRIAILEAELVATGKALNAAVIMRGHEHWDSTGMRGTGCPKCIRQSETAEAIYAALGQPHLKRLMEEGR